MIFGQLTDIINEKELTVDGVTATDALITKLNKQYPALAQSKYILAVNKQKITGNTSLSDGDIVALLPPFSGG